MCFKILNIRKSLLVTNKNIKSGSKITLNANGIITTDKLTITDKIVSVGGDTKAELTKTDIKKMKSLKMIAGYAIDGGGSTHLLFEGGWHNLSSGKFNAWSNDNWDVIYIFKGWKVQVSEHSNGGGWKKDMVNKNEDVKKMDNFSDNKVSSYKVTWVDY